jgi:hypothetical protein
MSRALMERIKKLEVSKQTSDDVVFIIFKLATPPDEPPTRVIGLKYDDQFWYLLDDETTDQLSERVKADLMRQQPNRTCFIVGEIVADDEGNQRYLDRD